ncbi:MAG: HD domain-containing protein [Candidatus Freyarchaeota archaeon]
MGDWWEKILQSKDGGEVLIQNLKKIEEAAAPLLEKIVDTFPDFTPHDLSHSKNVIQCFNLIIPDSLKEELNAYEIFFLIASAYLHDIGMVNFPELLDEKYYEFVEKKRRINPKATDQQILRDYIRENHHLRSEVYIINNFNELGIQDLHQARIIGRICKGHREVNLHDKKLFAIDRMYDIGSSVNVPLLAALLRIADELDITFKRTYKRTPLIIYEHCPPKDIISKYEWEKHFSVAGVGVHPEDPLTIFGNATVIENPKIHLALKRLENKINRELDDLPNHLHQYRNCRKDMPRKFSMNIEAIGYKSYDIKFSLEEKKIINLLMGERLYKRKEESLRELLKNSVDACRYRKELLEKQPGIKYIPEIVFELTPDNRLIVTDNGAGMDEDKIERYLAKIGDSFYESEEFREKGVKFTPVSELGIGILSCFMIANKIVIETKTDDSDPLLVEIEDSLDYFFVTKGKNKSTGTTVTLFLKEGEIDLEKEVRFYARHLEFPVKVILPNGKKITIESAGFKPDEEALLGEFAKKYSYYLISVNHEHVEGSIGILFEKDEKLNLKPIDNLGNLKPIDKAVPERFDNFFISNQGIFVCGMQVGPERNLLFSDLNLKEKDVLTLNVSRNDIVPNEKFLQFIEFIETKIVSSMEDFLKTLERKAKEAKIDFIKLSNHFFKNYVDLLNISDFYFWFIKNQSRVVPSDKLLNLIKRFYYFKYISKNKVGYMKYDEIKRINKPLVVLRFLADYWSDEDLQQVFSKCDGFTENYIYLMPESNTRSFEMDLFEDVRYAETLEFFDIEISKELEDIIPEKGFEIMIPREYRLVRFKNYTTCRLLERLPTAREFSGERYFFNRDHRFIDLLVKNKTIISENTKNEIKEFFTLLITWIESSLRREFFFKRLLSDHRNILKRLVDEKVINEDEISNYLLTKDDFPPYLCT